MKNTYIPYTYLIGWSKIKKYYYGVRYANNCNPTDLWIKYFTSSSYVSEIRKLYGEPDIIQVRKTFATKEEAINWEVKVLKRMKVVLRKDFLNENDVAAPPINNRIMSSTTKEKISYSNKGKPKSDEHKRKIKEARAKQDMSWRKNLKHSQITIDKIKKARAKQIITEETKQKMSLAQFGERHWAFNKKQKIIECPHCRRYGGVSNMKRWHFNNCKNFGSKDE